MSLGAARRGDAEAEDQAPAGGLLCGLTPWHVRVLCDHGPRENGRAYTPGQVGDMTLDQVVLLFVDRKMLLKQPTSFGTSEVGAMADEQGFIKGRAADGTAIKARIGGKSKARQLMEEEAARQKAQRPKRRSRKGGQ